MFFENVIIIPNFFKYLIPKSLLSHPEEGLYNSKKKLKKTLSVVVFVVVGSKL